MVTSFRNAVKATITVTIGLCFVYLLGRGFNAAFIGKSLRYVRVTCGIHKHIFSLRYSLVVIRVSAFNFCRDT